MVKEEKEIVIEDEKLKKYFGITEKALKIAEKAIAKGKEKEASEILEMVKCYLSDAHHFETQNNSVNAFACINYAHGWLDCGARLKIFLVTDSKLFTV